MEHSASLRFNDSGSDLVARFKKGQRVKRSLNMVGVTTGEEETVLMVRKGEVWLDNGPGNDPSGPFDDSTGMGESWLGIDYISEVEDG
jgi:hypothetical protein